MIRKASDVWESLHSQVKERAFASLSVSDVLHAYMTDSITHVFESSTY